MYPRRRNGNLLMFVDDHENADRLRERVREIGERAVLLTGEEMFLLDSGDDDSVGLVVVWLQAGGEPSAALRRRLRGDELLPGVPRLWIGRDDDLELDGAPGACHAHVPAGVADEELRFRLATLTEIGRLSRELDRSAIHDELTGLLNRRSLLARAEQEFARARRTRAPTSIVRVDLDDLKRINAAHGHTVGDRALVAVANVLRTLVRRSDVAGRVSGNGFAVSLACSPHRGAAVFANKVRSNVEVLDFDADGRRVRLSVSGGISTYPTCGGVENAEGLQRRAETALLRAKLRGGNQVFIDEAVVEHEQRLIVVADRDPAMLELADDLLSLDDFRVTRADDPSSVLETLRFRPPDLLILDLGLGAGEGQEASALLARVRELHPESQFPVIGLSADADADPAELDRLGLDRFITKPFSLSLLRSAARELIELEPAG